MYHLILLLHQICKIVKDNNYDNTNYIILYIIIINHIDMVNF